MVQITWDLDHLPFFVLTNPSVLTLGGHSCADPEWGTGGPDPFPPEKSQKYRGNGNSGLDLKLGPLWQKFLDPRMSLFQTMLGVQQWLNITITSGVEFESYLQLKWILIFWILRSVCLISLGIVRSHDCKRSPGKPSTWYLCQQNAIQMACITFKIMHCAAWASNKVHVLLNSFCVVLTISVPYLLS